MEPSEAAFYKALYRVVSSQDFDLVVKYGKIKQDQAVKQVRSKKEIYEYGFNNGYADAWEEIITLRSSLIKIMQNIG